MSALNVAALLLTCIACATPCEKARPRPEVSAFFRLPAAEQIRTLKEHPVEEQLELYFFGTEVRHPPAEYLARPLAERGSLLFPMFETKLKGATQGVVVRDIADVLSEMATLKVHDFSRDPYLLDLAERKARELGGVWMSTTLQMVAEARGSAAARHQ